jgi:predicted transglutaminase-like cysteine proteinase
MLRRMLVGLVVLVWTTGNATVYAGPSSSSEGASVIVGVKTTRPIGHQAFCQTHPDECGPNEALVEVVPLSDALFAQLTSINDSINASVKAVTDREFYRVTELWAYPDGAGDCEDFVLAKRRALNAAGWPLSTLLITVVRESSGEAHAVLTVRTDRGDLVLDNLDGDVHRWSETPYTFLKRQSQEDAGVWVAISDDRSIELVASH